jgi:hypothetical protein
VVTPMDSTVFNHYSAESDEAVLRRAFYGARAAEPALTLSAASGLRFELGEAWPAAVEYAQQLRRTVE